MNGIGLEDQAGSAGTAGVGAVARAAVQDAFRFHARVVARAGRPAGRGLKILLLISHGRRMRFHFRI